jgi:hypothetical protein
MLSPKQLAATNFLDAHHSPTEYLIVVFLNIMHIFLKKKSLTISIFVIK